jgi:hypothetical protein
MPGARAARAATAAEIKRRDRDWLALLAVRVHPSPQLSFPTWVRLLAVAAVAAAPRAVTLQESVAVVEGAVPATVVKVSNTAQPVPGMGLRLSLLEVAVVVEAEETPLGLAAMAATGSSSSAQASQLPPTR